MGRRASGSLPGKPASRYLIDSPRVTSGPTTVHILMYVQLSQNATRCPPGASKLWSSESTSAGRLGCPLRARKRPFLRRSIPRRRVDLSATKNSRPAGR